MFMERFSMNVSVGSVYSLIISVTMLLNFQDM